MDLALAAREVRTYTVVGIEGEVDVHTAGRLRDYLTALFRAGRVHLILDLEAVTFLDSTGMGVLVGALKRARVHDGSVQVVCANQRILRLLEITGLNRAFVMHASVENALCTGAGQGELGPLTAASAPGAAR